MPKVAKKSAVKKIIHKTDCSLPVYNQEGVASGEVAVAKTVFDVKTNPNLVAQAVRVYLANQRVGSASTKTRGEVEGSTRKIYRQKGTGRARHGGIRAPIFVGGGIVFGPKTREYRLDMPVAMKRTALFCALTQKRLDQAVAVLEHIDALAAKTKVVAQLLAKASFKGTVLLLVAPGQDKLVRSSRNLHNLTVMLATHINTYDVTTKQTVVFTKEGLAMFEQMVSKK